MLNKISTKIEEAALDQLHKLIKKRENLIADTGEQYAVLNTSHVIQAIQEGNALYCYPSAPIVPGSVLSNGNLLHKLIITSIEEQAGRLACTIEVLPKYVSISQAISKGLSQMGNVCYSIKHTAWRDIPASDIRHNEIKLPKAYTIERGELILLDGVYYQATEVTVNDVFCVCKVKEF